ncbi:MAG: hypothetical protein CK431_09970 [Mycobacterium sp.]|nr:MAG: hypothetical protein CK431_09970 [Mycobacterium sp.]
MSDDARPDAATDTDSAPQNGETTNDTEPLASAPESQPNNNPDVFPRQYVEELRKESAGYRDRAKQADERAGELAKRLHRELIAATARLENPDDLPFDAEHLDDPEKLSAAIDALLSERPYFAKRKVAGDAGQGPRGGSDGGVNLLELLRGNR